MASSLPYYRTQGGGTAVMQGDQLAQGEPPDWFTDAKVGEVVPEEWGVTGPYDRETNKSHSDD